MYELLPLGERTFYIDCPSRIGVILLDSTRVAFVDGGSDKDSAKKAQRAIEDRGFTLEKIIVTHSHADHIGGVAHLVERTGAEVYAKGIERVYSEYTDLEPISAWGGFPHKDIRNKFFIARPFSTRPIEEAELGDGFEILDLKGHTIDQIGVLSPDGTAFIADALASENTLEKYGVSFLFDVERYLLTLESLKEIKADVYLPSHLPPRKDISSLIELNVQKTHEVADIIERFLEEPLYFDALLKKVFDYYERELNAIQYAIIGTTVRSYLSYLYDKGRIAPIFEENKMLWKKA